MRTEVERKWNGFEKDSLTTREIELYLPTENEGVVRALDEVVREWHVLQPAAGFTVPEEAKLVSSRG